MLKSLLLWVNTLFELIIGTLFLGFPFAVFDNPSGFMLAMTRNFGFAAMTMGILSFLMWRKKLGSNRTGFITLAVFHSGLTVASIINLTEDLIPLGIVIAHAVLAVCFTYYATVECQANKC